MDNEYLQQTVRAGHLAAQADIIKKQAAIIAELQKNLDNVKFYFRVFDEKTWEWIIKNAKEQPVYTCWISDVQKISEERATRINTLEAELATLRADAVTARIAAEMAANKIKDQAARIEALETAAYALVDKIMTMDEWRSLSAESRIKVNAYGKRFERLVKALEFYANDVSYQFDWLR